MFLSYVLEHYLDSSRGLWEQLMYRTLWGTYQSFTDPWQRNSLLDRSREIAYCAALKDSASRLHHSCTMAAPQLHLGCPTAAPQLYHSCTTAAPQLHHCCSIAATWRHHSCTTAVPQLQHCFTTAAPLQQHSCTTAAKCCSLFYLCSSSLQRRSDLCIPRNETARPRSQFPDSCICEWYIYSYILLQQNRRTIVGI